MGKILNDTISKEILDKMEPGLWYTSYELYANKKLCLHYYGKIMLKWTGSINLACMSINAILQRFKNVKSTLNNATNENKKEFVEARFKRELLKQVDFNEDALRDIHQESVRTRNPQSAMGKIFAINILIRFGMTRSFYLQKK